jgi:hypothetical protein
VSAWHVEIRDADDRVLTQVDCEVRKVSDIECVRSADFVAILVNGESTATGYLTTDQAKQETFTAKRWPLDGGEPVEVKIRA